MIDAIVLVFAVYNYFMTYSMYLSPSLEVVPFEAASLNMIVSGLALVYVARRVVGASGARAVDRPGTLLLLLILLLTTVASTANLISLRTGAQPEEYIHDHPLQIEVGLDFLTDGENPYTRDYTDTPVALWHGWTTNPAIHHFISLPSTLYLSLPLYVSWEGLFGWYDHRILSLLALALALWCVHGLLERADYRAIAFLAIGLNPFFTPHFIHGIEDIIFLAMLLLALLLLTRQQVLASVVVMALTVTSKQTAVFVLPFYALHLYQVGALERQFGRIVFAFAGIVLLALAPFLLWDAASFYADVYAYPAGTLATSYPIKGFGLSLYLVQQGVIPGTDVYFPFWILQAIFLGPLFLLLLHAQLRRPGLGQVLLNYGVLLWGFWFFSRFFNDSYIGVLTVIFTLGGLLAIQERGAQGGSAPSTFATQTASMANNSASSETSA